MVPGDRHNVVDRAVQMTGMEATDDRMRFPKQYAKFKLNQEQRVHDGLPLSAWPGIPSALAEELRFLNIFTVEQLAELADTYVSKIHGGHEWKRKAKEFSTALKDQAAVNKLQAQLAERDNRIEVLERNLAELTAKVDAAAKQRR
jgi:hypothetical protein